MKRFLTATLIGALTLLAGRTASAQPCHVERQQHATHLQFAAKQVPHNFAVVPFAIPVAVPVAVFAQPSVLYSYRDAATSYYVPSTSGYANGVAPAAATLPIAATILSQHCASCHGSAAPQGKLALFGTNGVLLEKLPRQLLLETIERGAMPPTGSSFTTAELDVLRAWAKPPRDLAY